MFGFLVRVDRWGKTAQALGHLQQNLRHATLPAAFRPTLTRLAHGTRGVVEMFGGMNEIKNRLK